MTIKTLAEIQDAILERVHGGETIDPDREFAAHPEHREALEQFFALLRWIEATPTSEAPPPARLGEFRIIREVGRGGMGVVYEAEQPSLRRRVALKVLPSGMRADRRLLQRFQREAEAAGRLRHPHIVPVFSCGESGNVPFFAMELVEGESLAEWIARRRDAGERTDWRECVRMVVKIASALAYAHGQGILHRDVKPANILLEADGTPRLTDFGLALDIEASALTVAGEVFGSPLYMSPEQAFRHEQPLDARTDVYSLGVVLYELLTLQLPYQGTTANEVLGALSSGRMVTPHERGVSLPPALEHVLMKALKSEASERTRSAAEFEADLQAVLDGRLSVPVDPTRRPRSAGRPARSQRPVWGRVATVVGLGLAFWFVLNVSGVFDRPDTVPDVEPPVLQSSPVSPVQQVERDAEEELRRLLDGTHADPEFAMRRLFGLDLDVPPILVRSSEEPATVTMSLNYESAIAAPEVSAVFQIEYAINNGDWLAPERGCGRELIPFAAEHLGGTLTFPIGYDLRRALRREILRGAASVRHRATVHLFRGDREILVHGRTLVPGDEFAESATGGTRVTWVFDPVSVMIFDDYPDDFPIVETSLDIDEMMTTEMTPYEVGIKGTGSFQDLQTFQLELRFKPVDPQAQVLDLACQVEVLAPGSDIVLARHPMRIESRHHNGVPNRRINAVLQMMQEEDLDPEAAAWLESAVRGEVDEVRIVFRPDRDEAMRSPVLGSYWGGEVDAVVPLQKP